jgi:hypothetical protein
LNNSISVNDSRISTSTDLLDNTIEHELSSYDLLDQLAPKYEEIQRVLDFLHEPFRNILLGIALSSAINSSNP